MDDIFNIAKPPSRDEFYHFMYALEETLEDPAAFLTDEHMEVLIRMMPATHVSIVSSTACRSAYLSSVEVMPPILRRIVIVDPASKGTVFAVCEALAMIIYENAHYSVALVDLIEKRCYHFDSFPLAGHASHATQLVTNLASWHLVADPVIFCNFTFTQTTTLCGMYALLAARVLEDSLYKFPDHPDRDELFMQVMHNAANEVLAVELRIDFKVLVHNAFLLLFNSVTDEEESAEQALFLGPLCNRRALRTLTTTCMPTSEMFLRTLSMLQPPGSNLKVLSLHLDQKFEMSSEAIANLCENPLLAFVVYTASDHTIVYASFLMVAMGATRLLCIPEATGSAKLRAIVTQIATTCNAIMIHVGSHFSRALSPVAFPLAAMTWWKRTRREITTDSAQYEFERMFSHAERKLPPGGQNDWLVRYMFANAMIEGNERLVAAHHEAEAAAERNPVIAYLTALGTGAEMIRRNIEMERSRTSLDEQMITVFSARIDEALCIITMEQGPRWKASPDPRTYENFYEAVLCSAPLRKISTTLCNVVMHARLLARDQIHLQAVETLLYPVIDAAFKACPVCLIVTLPNEDDPVAIAGVSDPRLRMALQIMVNSPEGSAVQLMVAPVAMVFKPKIVSGDHHVDGAARILGYRSIYDIEELARAKKLRPVHPAMATLSRPSLRHMGGHGAADHYVMEADREPLPAHVIPCFFPVSREHADMLIPLVNVCH